jgi:hypothetical protein
MSTFYPIQTGRKLCPASPAAAVPLSPTPVLAQKAIMLTNDSGAIPNGSTGICYWGGPGVTTATGSPLRPGSSVAVSTDNTDAIYVVASDATTTVSWAAV